MQPKPGQSEEIRLLAQDFCPNYWEQVFSWEEVCKGQNANVELLVASCHQEGMAYLLKMESIQ